MSFTKLLRTAMVAASLITQGTLTAQTPGLSHTATWNNAGVTFIAQTLDVTDTASAAGSLLARWRVGGVTQFSVSKAGAITAGAASFTTGAFSGNVTINTNKVTFDAATGNTVVAGTLGVTGASTLTGNVGVGGASQAYAGLRVISATITGVNQWGVDSQPTFQSSATTSARAVMVKMVTAAAAFTMTSGYGVSVAVPTVGAASAITTLYGVHVDNQGASGVTNAYGVYIAAQSGAATTNIGLYNGGTLSQQGAATFASTVAVTGVAAVGGATLSASTALITPAGTTAISSLRIPHGAAPTSPVDGDVWSTTAGWFIRINGVTKTVTLT